MQITQFQCSLIYTNVDKVFNRYAIFYSRHNAQFLEHNRILLKQL